MSATCIHPDADAPDHPECEGCSALIRYGLPNVPPSLQWASTASDPIVAIQRVIAAQSQEIERQEEERLRRIRGHSAERVIIDDPHPPQPLLDRDPTPEDLEAERDQPRQGVWAGEPGADLRLLTQDETDALIRAELYWKHATSMERDQVAAAIAAPPQGPPGLRLDTRDARGQRPWLECQRGGIDSDPLVRILARRAWGDRDRQWFALRGVRKGDGVETVAMIAAAAGSGRWTVATTWRATSWPPGIALADARPGERVVVEWPQFHGGMATHECFVSDRLREPPYEAIDRINQAMLSGFPPAASDGAVRAARFAELVSVQIDGITADLTRDIESVILRNMETGAINACARAFHHGMRRTAPARPTPPVPPWARERRTRSPRPPTR